MMTLMALEEEEEGPELEPSLCLTCPDMHSAMLLCSKKVLARRQCHVFALPRLQKYLFFMHYPTGGVEIAIENTPRRMLKLTFKPNLKILLLSDGLQSAPLFSRILHC